MIVNNIRMAWQSIRSARWRSLMTMIGVILGVLSVVSIVSIGEGVKREIVGQIDHLGADLVTVKSGRSIVKDENGQPQSVDLLQALAGGGSLAEADQTVVRATPNAGVSSPVTTLGAVPIIDSKEYPNYLVLGVNDQFPELLKQKIIYGGFYNLEDANTNTAVIGTEIARDAFNENAPIGRSLQIRGETFIVRGVFDRFNESPLALNTNYNNTIFIPYDVAKRLNGGQAQIQQILVRPNSPAQADKLAENLRQRLAQAHGGQSDVTVLTQKDTLFVANRVVDLLTGLISAIAAISLFVGGVGIMNIMLVSVSERTSEIGVRKAIGATNGQILSQFAIEASVISFVGGIIGLLGSLVVNYFIRILTDLKPVITWQVLAVSMVVAMAVGIFFGAAPAIKAARKDPIEALRSN